MKKVKSIKFNFVMNLIRVLMTILFPLITYPYATRILHTSGMGKATYVASIVSYFQLIAAFGVNNYAITEGAKIRDDKQKLNKFASEMFFINLISTVVAYVSFVVFLFIPKFEEYQSLLLISSTTILFTTLGMEWLYELLEEYRYITIRSVVFQVISLVALFLFVRDEKDVAWYVALTAISTAGSGIMNFFHSKKYVQLFHEKIDTGSMKRHIKPMFYMFGVSIASVVYLNSDITMLGLMRNDAEVGIYSAATKMNQVVCTLIKSLSTVIMARLAYYIETKQKENFERLLRRAFSFMLMLIIPCMVGMWIIAPEIIMLIAGEEYMAAVTPEKIMILNLFFSPINGFIAYQIFMPYNKEKIIFWATCGGAVTNLIINFILIPEYSYNGAAIATVIAEGMVMLISLILGRKLINIWKMLKGGWQYIIACLPMLLAYFVIPRSAFSNYLMYMFLMIAIGVVSYFLALLLMRNEIVLEEWNRIMDIIKNKVLRKKKG